MKIIAFFLLFVCSFANAQTAITVTVPANVAQLVAMQAWCQFYTNLAGTPTAPQLQQCVAILLQRAVQSYSVQTQSSAITPAPFNPN